MTRRELTFPPKTGGRVRDLSQEGEGILALESPDSAWQGRVVFVPGALPGDEVLAHSYVKVGRRWLVDSFALVRPSPDRKEAFCPHFGSCGGCQLQSLNYAATLSWKQKHVTDLLRRIGKIALAEGLVKPCLGTQPPLAFRSIVRLHVNAQGQLCFFGLRPQELIPLETCPIQSSTLNGLRDLLNELLRRQMRSEVAKLSQVELRQNAEASHFMLVFDFHTAPLAPDWQDFFSQLLDQAEALLAGATISLGLLVGEGYVHIAGPPQLRMRENGLNFEFSPRAFQQTNLQLNQVLYQEVVKAAQLDLGEDPHMLGEGPHILGENPPLPDGNPPLPDGNPHILGKGLQILELYCGSGTISLHLARAFPEAQITGVEIVAEAIADAQHNAELNGLASDRLHFLVGDAGLALRGKTCTARGGAGTSAGTEAGAGVDAGAGADAGAGETQRRNSQITPLCEGSQPYDLLVLDPPRQGLDPQLCQDILDSGIPHIIYVSCDPATLARDLQTLKQVYQLKHVQPLDMFPWTTHVETVCLLEQK